MSKRFLVAITLLLTLTLGVASLSLAQDDVAEVPVTLIELAGPVAEPDAEVSGLTWYGDMLILLAENPNIYATEDNAGMFYALDKADILAYLDADAPEPLEPLAIPIVAPDIVETVPDELGFANHTINNLLYTGHIMY